MFLISLCAGVWAIYSITDKLEKIEQKLDIPIELDEETIESLKKSLLDKETIELLKKSLEPYLGETQKTNINNKDNPNNKKEEEKKYSELNEKVNFLKLFSLKNFQILKI